MPTYTVESGEMLTTIDTEFDARPGALLIMALMDKKPEAIGSIALITGGEYVGDNAVYISCEAVLCQMGMLQTEERQ